MRDKAVFSSLSRLAGTPGLAAVLLVSVTALGTAAATPLAPHRAVYDLSLESADSRSSISSVRGRMVHEFDGTACDGYTVNMRWVAIMGGGSDGDTVDDVRFASWEDGQGESYTYTSTRYLDDKLVEEVKAHAERGDTVNGGSVSLSKPSEENIGLPPRTIFPTAHLKNVIAAAASGKRFAEDKVYDVSEDGRQIYNTLAVVGARSNDDKDLKDVDNTEVLNELPAWRVTISYFKGASQGEETPAFEQTFDLFANGVASSLILDYGDIVIKGTLKNLEYLTLSECAN